MTDPQREALAQTIDGARFTVTRVRQGYDIEQVDRLLAGVATELRAGSHTAPLVAQVLQSRFSTAALRQAYDMSDVDRFLDQLVSLLSTLPGVPGQPAAGAEIPVTSADDIPMPAQPPVALQGQQGGQGGGPRRRLFGRRPLSRP